ncbi:CTP synthase [Rozella allomycis CSF55]|uniref:CTP synthase n=1 Tax=Rozella allomycis (strain CSF55) TaxID=988480 RepID=A0A075AY42_ROZAC|nr:CTP synthase [Rozella allomycis CSF55]RKP18142.1 CTP synthase [Rozella allomycis CSF55]|eukprot:EPZ33602.1 CTP synthase [Rozella allomycis CSF55]
MVKYILVTGGVISGIGKGVIASSTGLLLKSYGLHVTAIKIDPYLNIDAGTLSPLDHGEVFTLDDGGEVDLDLGNYERFLDVTLTRDNNITTGKIYKEVIEKERRGDYLGKTVQVVPHITEAIQDWIQRVSRVPVDGTNSKPDVCIIELGGTVGDIESAPFVEAMRQFQFRVGHENFCLIHVSLVPVVGSVGEQKTKPTQSGVRDLRGLGLSPDIIACRCTNEVDDAVRSKISMFCHVPPSQVLSVPDCPSVYHIPLLLESQNLLSILEQRLNLKRPVENPFQDLFPKWIEIANSLPLLESKVTIALVGKYTHLKDSYISVSKALNHAAVAEKLKLEIKWIEASDLEENSKVENLSAYNDAWELLKSVNGILVPGGFGERGTEGKISAIKYARENNVPYLGICLGLQLAVIEFARHVLNLRDAHSTEFVQDAKNPIVIFMPEISKTHLGGTMRLGSRPTKIVSESKSKKLYGNVELIHERHRHRFEINPKYIEELEKHGMKFVGKDENHERMEIIELDNHPFFLAAQFHPEYLTRPLKPCPLFKGFIRASKGIPLD